MVLEFDYRDMMVIRFSLGTSGQSWFIKIVLTKTRNEPKQVETNRNGPKSAETTQKIQNDRK